MALATAAAEKLCCWSSGSPSVATWARLGVAVGATPGPREAVAVEAARRLSIDSTGTCGCLRSWAAAAAAADALGVVGVAAAAAVAADAGV